MTGSCCRRKAAKQSAWWFAKRSKLPITALKVIDDAIQAFGGAGVTEDFGLAAAYAGVRTLRIADGPDEVHRRTIARLEYRKAKTRSEKKAAR